MFSRIASILLILLLSFFSTTSFAIECSYLFKGPPLYQRSLEIHQKLKPEESIQRLMEKADKEGVQIDEVIAVLDAHNSSEVKLLDKVNQHVVRPKKESSSLINYLLSPVKVRRTEIYLRKTEFHSEKETREFITRLLKSVHKVEMKILKDQLFKILPHSKVRVARVIESDRFFYENNNIFSQFLALAKKDYLPNNPVLGSLYNFFFFTDPILSHRLNLRDLNHYQNQTLDSAVTRRLFTPIISRAVQRKLFWSTIATAVLMIPYNIQENIQSIQKISKSADYYISSTENQKVATQIVISNYTRTLQEMTAREIQKNTIQLEEAKKQNNQNEIIVIESTLQELLETQKQFSN